MRISDWISDVCSSTLSSEPNPDPGHETDCFGIFPGKPRQSRSLASLFDPFHANVRCEFPPNLIAQARAQFEVGQTRSYPDRRHVLSGDVELRPRLENQALGNALIITSLKASPQITLVRKKHLSGQMEPVGCAPPYPESGKKSE